jgi:hypothetical protein
MNFHQHTIQKQFTKYSPTAEHRQKIAQAITGKKHKKMTREKISKQLLGEKAYQWKGDNASYGAKHKRLVRKYGKIDRCEFCGCDDAKFFDWANISGEYRYQREDWYTLCRKCHNGWDVSRRRGYENEWLKINNIKRLFQKG